MTWSEAWEEGETPWDAGAAAPVLLDLVDRGDLPDGRAMVPGCGSGYDVLALAQEDRDVVGVDLAEGAAKRFEQLRSERDIPASQARYRVGDFFDMRFSGEFDLIFDYTFLCAIPYVMRRKWARRMARLIRPGGELVTLIFPAAKPGVGPVSSEPPASPASSPPYRLIPDTVWHLVAPAFECIDLSRVEHSHAGREDREWLGRWRRTDTPYD